MDSLDGGNAWLPQADRIAPEPDGHSLTVEGAALAIDLDAGTVVLPGSLPEGVLPRPARVEETPDTATP